MSLSKFAIVDDEGFNVLNYVRYYNNSKLKRNDEIFERKTRQRRRRPDYEGTHWYKEYVIDSEGTYDDPNSLKVKLFRLLVSKNLTLHDYKHI